ncbi:MAG: hypothetical protein WCI72_03190 [archaeon]
MTDILDELLAKKPDNTKMNKLIDDLLTQKTENGKKPLQVPGLSFIHPMHEAAVAFFQRNVSSGQICQIFAKDENSLRKAIALEVLADNLDPQKKAQALAKVGAGGNLNEIVDLMALSYAEGRRVHNGNVIKEVHVPTGDSGKYFVEAVRQLGANPIYMEGTKADGLRAKATEIEKKTIRKRVLKALTIGTLVAATGIYIVYNARTMGANQTKIAGLEKDLKAYSNVVYRMPAKESIDFMTNYKIEQGRLK